MTARTRMTASVAAVGAATLMGLAFAGPAFAVDEPYGGSAATACTTVTFGQSCTVSGKADESPAGTHSIEITFHSTPVSLATLSVAAGGQFSTTVTVPSSTQIAAGAHTIQVYDATSKRLIATLDVTVVAAATSATATSSSSSSSSGTSATGVAVAGLGAVGIALVGGGAALAIAGRRRRTHA